MQYLKRIAYSCLLVVLMMAAAHLEASPTAKSIQIGKLKRKYWVHLPRDYEQGKQYPMVMMLHGRFGTGDKFLKYSDVGFIADREGFIVVAPDGYKKSWNDGRLATPAKKANVDDIAFLTALIDEVQKQYTIDASKIYCVGMSNGGFMTLALNNKIGKRLAAIGIFVASAPVTGVDAYLPTTPTPMIMINGTDDPLIKYKGGPITKKETEPIMATEEFVGKYCTAIGCGEGSTYPYVDKYVDGTMTTVHQWQSCASRAEVELWEVVGGGHSIPSKAQYLPVKFVGNVGRDFDGMEVMCEFLRRFGGA
jgi:polyhydroxybutyrate depolymerase